MSEPDIQLKLRVLEFDLRMTLCQEPVDVGYKEPTVKRACANGATNQKLYCVAELQRNSESATLEEYPTRGFEVAVINQPHDHL